MNVAFNSREVLHLSVSPGIKSWSIFVGIMSVGVGASCYSPDEHFLMKIAYLTGCLVLGLTFLDDWEDCVFDLEKGQVTLTRRNWFEWLTSRCADHNTLVLDTNSVMAVRVIHINGSRYSEGGYKVALALRTGGTVPVSETRSGLKNDQEELAKHIRHFLSLDRVETLRNTWQDWTESEEEEPIFIFHQPVEVESLKGRGDFNFEDLKLDDDNRQENVFHDTDSSSGEEDLYDDL